MPPGRAPQRYKAACAVEGKAGQSSIFIGQEAKAQIGRDVQGTPCESMALNTTRCWLGDTDSHSGMAWS